MVRSDVIALAILVLIISGNEYLFALLLAGANAHDRPQSRPPSGPFAAPDLSKRPRYVLRATDEGRAEITSYSLGQSAGGTVFPSLQKVHSETVLGHRHDVEDADASDRR